MSFEDYINEFAPYLHAVAGAAEETGCSCYLVGGAIRQMLLGTRPDDLDFIVSSRGMAERLAQAVFKRLEEASKPMRVNDVPTIELRVNGLLLHFADPVVDLLEEAESVYAPVSNEVKADVLRRDFTVNTLLLPADDPRREAIIDATALGLPDIQHRRLRTPVEAGITLKEDPLRMLRAIRFYVTERFVIKADLATEITAHAHLIADIPGERVQHEFSEIITSNQPADAISLMNKTALLHYLFPNIDHLSQVHQHHDHYTGDVLSHTCRVLELSPPILRVRLAALFHDVGKASTLTEEDGKTIFYGHQHTGSEMTRERLKQLRYSNAICDDVTKLVDMHMITYSYDWSDVAVRRLVRNAGPLLDDLMLLYRADISARTEPYNNLAEYNHLMQRIKMLDLESIINATSPLKGEEVMSIMGISAGPEVGEIQKDIEQAIIDGRIDQTPEAARDYLQNAIKGRK